MAGPVTERTIGLMPEQSEGMKPTSARSLQAGASLLHADNGDRTSAEVNAKPLDIVLNEGLEYMIVGIVVEKMKRYK